MYDDRIKVLYIAGWGRSGSTILEKILGQIKGFFAAGELYSIWDRGLLKNRYCSCGNPFNKCEVWETIIDRAYGGKVKIDAHEMLNFSERSIHAKNFPLMLMNRGKPVFASRLSKYLRNIEKLYQSIKFTTNSKVIIDSSKSPFYGYVLTKVRTIDLYVVHMIRDPRAVAYSWQRKKLFQPDTRNNLYMAQLGPILCSLRWNMQNLATEAFWRSSPERYLMLRYEDFINQPLDKIKGILDLIEEEPSDLPFIGHHKVDLGKIHSVSGNPIRFQNGHVDLRLDGQWMSKMKITHRNLISFLTSPLLKRYNYDFRIRMTPQMYT